MDGLAILRENWFADDTGNESNFVKHIKSVKFVTLAIWCEKLSLGTGSVTDIARTSSLIMCHIRFISHCQAFVSFLYAKHK